MRWSEEQEAIYRWFATAMVRENGTVRAFQNLVVQARAGTGKTTTILEGVVRAPEDRILIAAFNGHIRDEIKRRLFTSRAQAKTLHQLGLGYLYRKWKNAKLDKDLKPRERRGYRLAKDAMSTFFRQYLVESEARRQSGVTEEAPITRGPSSDLFYSVKNLANMGKQLFTDDPAHLQRILRVFNLLPEKADDFAYGWTDVHIAQCASKAMTAALEPDPDGWIDFEDMLWVPLKNKWVFGMYDLVVIDEAQDMNKAQLYLAQRACRRDGRIVLVGDDRQALYGFRGADSHALERTKDDLKAAKLGLHTTYRCPRLIVDLARRLVFDFRSAPEAPDGSIRRANEGHLLEQAMSGDFVLSRINQGIVTLCLKFIKRGQRARILGRSLGEAVVRLLQKFDSVNVGDMLPLLEAWRGEELLKAQEHDMPERAEYVQDLADVINELATGLTRTVDIEKRCQDLFTDNSGDSVTLSTVHRIKGLEARCVWILGDTFKVNGPEEDNVLYVAVTRSAGELVWVAEKHPSIAEAKFEALHRISYQGAKALAEVLRYELVELGPDAVEVDEPDWDAAVQAPLADVIPLFGDRKESSS